MSPESLAVLVEALSPEAIVALAERLAAVNSAGGWGRVTLTIEKGRLRWIETTVSEAAPGGLPPTKH